MTITKNMKTTNFKLEQREIVAELLPVFQQIDEMRWIRALDRINNPKLTPEPGTDE